MSKIDDDFVRRVANTWHRFEPGDDASAGLAEMLQPMDEAGESVSRLMHFDREPSDFLRGLEALSRTPQRK